ncbi:MAG: DNA polymerase III subunit delta' [Candidatus Poribacteria bacterium]|nr:DNA polymerase III subunit delta' [Candidatus Poribacteria bacterium]
MRSPIIGHEQIIEQLLHAIESNRVAGAYLFAGPANVGKETVALYFAKSINCTALEQGPCNSCLSCRKIDNGNHPDMQIINPLGAWMKIDQIRELQKRIVYRPLEGNRKVYILNEVDCMNLEAANCLLKTLEEPPAASVLVLITSNLDALLPTIRSRCQIIDFHLLTIPELSEYLVRQFNLEEHKAFHIASLSRGAVGNALTRLREKEDISYEEIPEIIESSDRLAAFRIAEKFNRDPDALEQLVSWYRDLLLLHQGAPVDSLTHIFHAQRLQQLTSRYSRLKLQTAIKTVFETRELLKRNVNSTLALEVMVLKLLPRT